MQKVDGSVQEITFLATQTFFFFLVKRKLATQTIDHCREVLYFEAEIRNCQRKRGRGRGRRKKEEGDC